MNNVNKFDVKFACGIITLILVIFGAVVFCVKMATRPEPCPGAYDITIIKPAWTEFVSNYRAVQVHDAHPIIEHHCKE